MKNAVCLVLYAGTHNDGELNVTWFQVWQVFHCKDTPEPCEIFSFYVCFFMAQFQQPTPSIANSSDVDMWICYNSMCNMQYVCFWSIKYSTNVMCNSHRKLAPRLLKRRCVVQHGTRHHDDVCVVFFNEFFFFFKTQAERRRALLVPSLNMSLSGLFTFWLTQVYKTNFLVILLYRYGLFFTKNANTAI